jgi:hypothetical protein
VNKNPLSSGAGVHIKNMKNSFIAYGACILKSGKNSIYLEKRAHMFLSIFYIFLLHNIIIAGEYINATLRETNGGGAVQN